MGGTDTHTLIHTLAVPKELSSFTFLLSFKNGSSPAANLPLKAPWIYENSRVYHDTQNRKSLTKLICHHFKQPLYQLLSLKIGI